MRFGRDVEGWSIQVFVEIFVGYTPIGRGFYAEANLYWNARRVLAFGGFVDPQSRMPQSQIGQITSDIIYIVLSRKMFHNPVVCVISYFQQYGRE